MTEVEVHKFVLMHQLNVYQFDAQMNLKTMLLAFDGPLFGVFVWIFLCFTSHLLGVICQRRCVLKM